VGQLPEKRSVILIAITLISAERPTADAGDY